MVHGVDLVGAARGNVGRCVAIGVRTLNCPTRRIFCPSSRCRPSDSATMSSASPVLRTNSLEPMTAPASEQFTLSLEEKDAVPSTAAMMAELSNSASTPNRPGVQARNHEPRDGSVRRVAAALAAGDRE